MAIDSRDPVTGAPQFNDTGAPDIGVDPTEVAKFAADVGTRIIRASLAELELYEWKRAGLAGHASGIDYLHDGTGWVPVGGGGKYTVPSFAANWSATSGYAPTVVREGNRRTLVGAATRGVGGSLTNLFTLPVGDRPADYVFLGAGATSAGVAFQLRVAPTGVVDVPYGGGSSAATYPLAGTWWVS